MFFSFLSWCHPDLLPRVKKLASVGILDLNYIFSSPIYSPLSFSLPSLPFNPLFPPRFVLIIIYHKSKNSPSLLSALLTDIIDEMAPKVGVKRSAPGKENEPPRTAKKTKTSAAAKKTPAAKKAKASDSDAAPTPAEPDRLPRGNAERLAQSQSAPSTNPRGLGRIPLPSDIISRLDDSWASAAYIMDFRTVAPVRAYYVQRPGQARPPDNRAVIDSWHAARSSVFVLPAQRPIFRA